MTSRLVLFTTDHLPLPLPPGHRFPVAKYALLRARVEQSSLVVDLNAAPAATDAEILRAHSPEYLHKVVTGTLSPREVQRLGLPWSPELVTRARHSAGGTVAACRAAVEQGIAVNLAGGTHHAFRDAAEGYCVFNDAVIAARAAQADGLADRVVVLDLDVHQGNGTAAICRDDPTIFTFSLHGAKNFPLHKEVSDLDVELPDGTTDGAYLAAAEQGVFEALNRARADLAIFLAGADPYEGDRLGRLKVSKDGLARRTEMVLRACRDAGVAVAVTMAGGYAERVEDTVDIYFETVRQAHLALDERNVSRRPAAPPGG